MQFLDQSSLFNRLPLPFSAQNQQLIERLTFRLIHYPYQTGILAQIFECGMTLITIDQNQAVVLAGYRKHRFQLAMARDRVRQPAYPCLVLDPDVGVAQFKQVKINGLLFHGPFLLANLSKSLRVLSLQSMAEFN